MNGCSAIKKDRGPLRGSDEQVELLGDLRYARLSIEKLEENIKDRSLTSTLECNANIDTIINTLILAKSQNGVNDEEEACNYTIEGTESKPPYNNTEIMLRRATKKIGSNRKERI